MPVAVQSEPTPDFNERCLHILEQWEQGETPYKTALMFLAALREEAIRSAHLANQGRAEHLMGYIQHYRGNLTISIHHYEQARSLYRQVGNQRLTASIDLNLGENYRFKGEFNRALRLYRSAYEAAAKIGYMKIQTMAATNEGNILLAVGQIEEAYNAFQTALVLAENWTEDLDQLPAVLCEVYYGLAAVYLQEGEIDLACDAAIQTLETAQQTHQPLLLGFANRAIGEVLTALRGKTDPRFPGKVDDYFLASLDAFREINAEAEMARTMYTHALSLAARGKRTAAARKLQQVMIIFTRLEMIDDAARAAEAQLAVI